MLQKASDSGAEPLVAAAPAYLSDELDRRFTLVREDAACPFCSAAKNVGALACYTCYGAEVMRELGGDDLAVLEARETVLATGRQPIYEEVAVPTSPQRSVDDARVFSIMSRSMLTIAVTMVLFFILALWAVSRSFSQRAVVAREVPAGAFEPGGVRTVAPSVIPSITDENRRTAALVFVKTVFDVDRETREDDLKVALAMMTPEAAAEFAQGLRKSGALEQERREGVRAWWQREAVEIDPLDPSVVRLRGRQMVDRAGGLPSIAIPMTIKITMEEDPHGRTPQNQMTGLRVKSFEVERSVGGR